ncbi:hypothetical protein [Actinophytocola algeriensis]|uniref:Uncharacterized protein n=1 Tax=Actinophytocola algeriensis TaxID=1768010 RepID=A0A7W7VJN9_9PSEU|nr:hypothetical protein [Actinophytocola algeriensis]MBB4912766.1 hypothetical protein [Actinophytocola algeriensis]MBE1473566.1 hypothetical protein [Actinophytocola algeriensis]
MSTPDQAAREQAARRVLHRLQQRTTLNEGIGILQTWNDCEQQQARDQLRTDNGSNGQNVEADRMIAVVNATADATTDPDADWD